MNRLVTAGVGVLALVVSTETAHAQFGPVIWQQPAPVIWQQPAPVIWQQPAPVVVSQRFPTVASPVVVSPAPVARFYRPPIITYQPVRRTYTRNRPILGGSVSRSRYSWQRVAF